MSADNVQDTTRIAATELAVRRPAEIEAPITNGEIDMLLRLANGLSKSGFFKDAKQQTQAFAKLLFGRDLGLSATQAMTDIHIVEGKPEMSANLQASKVLASDRYDYRITEHDDTKCSIEFGPYPAPGKDGTGTWLAWPQSFGISTFTMKDAEQAGLAGKNNWKHYPRNMLFARAMSNGVAWYCPDVTNGIRVYAEGEVRETFPAEPEQEAAPEPAATLDITVVEALSEGVDLAGWDDALLRMQLIDLGLVDVADPHAALATLSPGQAEVLSQRLSDEVAARDADQQPADAEVVS